MRVVDSYERSGALENSWHRRHLDFALHPPDCVAQELPAQQERDRHWPSSKNATGRPPEDPEHL